MKNLGVFFTVSLLLLGGCDLLTGPSTPAATTKTPEAGTGAITFTNPDGTKTSLDVTGAEWGGTGVNVDYALYFTASDGSKWAVAFYLPGKTHPFGITSQPISAFAGYYSPVGNFATDGKELFNANNGIKLTATFNFSSNQVSSGLLTMAGTIDLLTGQGGSAWRTMAWDFKDLPVTLNSNATLAALKYTIASDRWQAIETVSTH